VNNEYLLYEGGGGLYLRKRMALENAPFVMKDIDNWRVY
jgi:hypothetical protein